MRLSFVRIYEFMGGRQTGGREAERIGKEQREKVHYGWQWEWGRRWRGGNLHCPAPSQGDSCAQWRFLCPRLVQVNPISFLLHWRKKPWGGAEIMVSPKLRTQNPSYPHLPSSGHRTPSPAQVLGAAALVGEGKGPQGAHNQKDLCLQKAPSLGP